MAEQINPDPHALPTAEELSAMDGDALEAHEQAIRDEAQELIDRSADLSDAEATRLTELAGHVDAIDAERDTRAQVAAERQAAVEDAASRFRTDDEADTDDGDAEAEETLDPVDQPEDGEDGDAEVVDEAPADEAPAAVAASSRRRSTASTMRPRPVRRPAGQTRGMHTIIAAADSGRPAGSQLTDMGQVAEAFIARSKGFPRRAGAATRIQFQVASIERDYASTVDGLYDGNPDYKDGMELLAAAGSEKRLKGQSLIASGGWCAPSETLYDITADETLDGIIDLPTIGVTRGGINFTPGPDFSDIYTAAGFHQTEAQAIAGDTKDCVEVDCPDFDEVRLDAVGICVKAPLLTEHAYPELVRRWLDGTTVANQHKVGASIITAMRTALGSPLAPTLTGTPVTWATLSAIELVIETQRQAYRLSETEALEVIAPRWLRAAIRADLANRNHVGADSVSNAQIAAHFADRGAAVQWVLGYLEISSPLSAVAWPSTAEVMVYPAGTFVRGNASVVNLSTVYDSTDLQTNVYTAAFVEDGVLVAKRKNGGKAITLPVHPNGMMASNPLNDDIFSVQS